MPITTHAECPHFVLISDGIGNCTYRCPQSTLKDRNLTDVRDKNLAEYPKVRGTDPSCGEVADRVTMLELLSEIEEHTDQQ